MGIPTRGFLVQQVPGARFGHDFVPAGVQEEALHLEVGDLWRDRVVQIPEDERRGPHRGQMV